jgi:hypothetical protein
MFIASAFPDLAVGIEVVRRCVARQSPWETPEGRSGELAPEDRSGAVRAGDSLRPHFISR